MALSLKTVKKRQIDDYDAIMKGIKRKLQIELSENNSQLIDRYDMEMVRQSIAIATRQKHLRTLLGLSRMLQKDWEDVTKHDMENLVYEIMQRHSDESGKETNYSYDHKKVLKIFIRWLRLDSREFVEVGDPPETAQIRMRRAKDKIIREDMLTKDDISRLLHVCGENGRDRALIDCHYEGGTRPGEILSILIKHVKFDQYGANLHVDGKTGPRTVRLIKSTPSLASWMSNHPFKNNPDAPVWINLNKNHYGEQLTYPAARAMFARRAKMAHLEKRVNLNMFRHSEATNSAKFMTEAQLRKRHGWSPESKMPARYVHLINADVDEATREKGEESYPSSEIFRDVLWYLVKLLETDSKCRIPKEYEKFVKHVHENQFPIISFNYDMIIETVLFKLNANCDYGADTTPIENGTLLMKMHGSVNWTYCTKCKQFVFYPDYQTSRVLANKSKCPTCKTANLEPIIIPPILYKDNFYKHPLYEDLIRQLWGFANDELITADKVVFVGFSMSETDAYAMELFKFSSNMNDSARYEVVTRLKSKNEIRELKKKVRKGSGRKQGQDDSKNVS